MAHVVPSIFIKEPINFTSPELVRAFNTPDPQTYDVTKKYIEIFSKHDANANKKKNNLVREI